VEGAGRERRAGPEWAVVLACRPPDDPQRPVSQRDPGYLTAPGVVASSRRRERARRRADPPSAAAADVGPSYRLGRASLLGPPTRSMGYQKSEGGMTECS